MTEQEQKAFEQMREALNSLCKLALSGESVLWTAEYDAARRALTAANAVSRPQATEPAGWKLVPVEPTQEMLDAVVTTLDDHLLGPDAEKQYREDWAAMLAAAPEAP